MSSLDSILLLLLVAWFHVAGSFAAAWVARRKGYNGDGWFLLSLLLLGPIISLLAVGGAPFADRKKKSIYAEPEEPPNAAAFESYSSR